MARNVIGGPAGFPRGFTADYFAEIGRLAVDLGNPRTRGGADPRPREGGPHPWKKTTRWTSLHRHLFSVLMDRAVDARGSGRCRCDVTRGRCYEHFADHAVEVARRVIFQVTGSLPADRATTAPR